MENLFAQFNNDIVEKIQDFCFGNDNVLCFEAPSGTGKSAITKTAINNIKSEHFEFYFYGSEASVIEDFLLNFYDTLRDYSLQKKIILKKDMNSDFAQKVSNYINSIQTNTIIIVDNFEKIENNEQIINFLVNLLKNQKIKIILLARTSSNLQRFEENGIKILKLKIENKNKEDFIQKMSFECPFEDLSSIKMLYDVARTNTILMASTFSYIKTTNVTLADLVKEYYKKTQTYESFIANKVLSLIPQNYMEFLKILSLINILVPIDFLKHYNLGNVELISYFQQCFVANKINQNVYIFEHFKKHVTSNLSIVEKTQLSTKLIQAFSEELTKSPKNRLLRLSREGIRNQIEFLEKNTPKINLNTASNTEANYYPQAKMQNLIWDNNEIDEGKKQIPEETNNQEDLLILRQLRESNFTKFEQEQTQKQENKEESLKEKINKAEKEFDYINAINLNEELIKITNDKNKIDEIYEKIAENYYKLNKKEQALNYLIKVSDNYKNNNKDKEHFKTLLKIAKIHQDIYEFSRAEKIYEKIISNCIYKEFIMQSYLELGIMDEKENKKDLAFENYNKALEIANEINDENKIAICNYNLAILFEEKGEIQKAKEYYKNSIKYDKNNNNIASCYSNLALIMLDENNPKEAIDYFELAIKKYLEEKNKNYSALYFANINISYIYKNINPKKQEFYLKEALKWTKLLDDSFETTNVLVELGDYYYNISNNKEALMNYLEAKDTLKENENSKNHQMILSRIEDMKYKLQGNFEKVIEEYEQKTN